MNYKLLILFIALNITNVIIQTVKSIATIKCGKWGAAITNAVAYGLYTFVVIYMSCELNIWLKAGIIAMANLIGVLTVKVFEERVRRDRLWEIRATVKPDVAEALDSALNKLNISHNYIVLSPSSNAIVFNIYSPNQKTSHAIRELLIQHSAKFFVSESKSL